MCACSTQCRTDDGTPVLCIDHLEGYVSPRAEFLDAVGMKNVHAAPGFDMADTRGMGRMMEPGESASDGFIRKPATTGCDSKKGGAGCTCGKGNEREVGTGDGKPSMLGGKGEGMHLRRDASNRSVRSALLLAGPVAEMSFDSEGSPDLTSMYLALLQSAGRARDGARSWMCPPKEGLLKATEAASGPMMLGPVPWRDGGVLLSSAMNWTFRYGPRVVFDVPIPWLLDYIIHPEQWDSAESTCAALWKDFRAAFKAKGGDWGAIHDLLGCYNVGFTPVQGLGIPYAGEYLFWNEGWGAPHKVYLNMCALVLAYVDHVNIESLSDQYQGWYSVAWCDGFDGFVKRLLKGKSARTSPLHEHQSACQLQIFFRSRDSDYMDVGFSKSCDRFGCACHEVDGSMADPEPEYRCGQGFNVSKSPGCGYHWDEFGLSIDSDGVMEASPCFNRGGYPLTDCEYPNQNGNISVNMAIGDQFGITFHAVYLAYDGHRCDWLMFMARVARQYARTCLPLGSADYSNYMAHADRLARYALRIIADWGRLLIHELGHTYCGAGHCVWDDCFDVASYHWLCKVESALGLPHSVSNFVVAQPTNIWTERGGNDTFVKCDVGDAETPGMEAFSRFCSAPCCEACTGCDLPTVKPVALPWR